DHVDGPREHGDRRETMNPSGDEVPPDGLIHALAEVVLDAVVDEVRNDVLVDVTVGAADLERIGLGPQQADPVRVTLDRRIAQHASTSDEVGPRRVLFVSTLDRIVGPVADPSVLEVARVYEHAVRAAIPENRFAPDAVSAAVPDHHPGAQRVVYG